MKVNILYLIYLSFTKVHNGESTDWLIDYVSAMPRQHNTLYSKWLINGITESNNVETVSVITSHPYESISRYFLWKQLKHTVIYSSVQLLDLTGMRASRDWLMIIAGP